MFVRTDVVYKMHSCLSSAFSRCVEITFDPVFQVLKTEKEKQDIFHREHMDDLLDKQNQQITADNIRVVTRGEGLGGERRG